MIGLIDLDLQTNSTPFPNIEIMKLATYYKTEEEQFCRLISLKDQELSAYETIYVFSEQDTPPPIPSSILAHPHLYLGGTGFTRGIYQPFQNSLIDFMLPRTDIYKEFLQQKMQENDNIKEIEQFLNNTYYRMYAGQERLPLPVIKTKKRVILYDKNFFVPKWQEIVQTISDRHPSTILTIHPIICTKVSQFFDVRKFSKISRGNEIVLKINVPESEIYYLFKIYQKRFLAEITSHSNVFLALGGNFNSTTQFYKDYLYTLHLLYSFWEKQIPIKIKFFMSPVGTQNPIINLSKLTESWSKQSLMKSKQSVALIQILNKKQNIIEKEEYQHLLIHCPQIEPYMKYSFKALMEGSVKI